MFLLTTSLVYIISLHEPFHVSVFQQMLRRKINRRSKGKEGWDVIRTKIILERFSKMECVSVDGSKYQLLGILGKGGYSCVYRFFSFLINIPRHLMSRGMSQDQNNVAVKITNIINADRKESDFSRWGAIFEMFRTVNERLVSEPGLMTHLSEVTEKAVVRVEAHKRLGDMMVMVMEMGEGTLMDVINK